MEPNFKVKFTFFLTCGSYKQCTGLGKKRLMQIWVVFNASFSWSFENHFINRHEHNDNIKNILKRLKLKCKRTSLPLTVSPNMLLFIKN